MAQWLVNLQLKNDQFNMDPDNVEEALIVEAVDKDNAIEVAKSLAARQDNALEGDYYQEIKPEDYKVLRMAEAVRGGFVVHYHV